jgi:hypothetical protein
MLPDRDLERELRELGSRVEYPPTPDLASAVRSRLDEGGGSAPPRRWFDLPVARWAAVAAVVLIAAVPVLSPAARNTVAGWFEGGQASSGGEALSGGRAAGGPEDATVMMKEDAESRADVPQSAGGPDMPASGGTRPSAAGSGFGERIPLSEAETRLAGRKLLLPGARGLGEPDEVYAYRSSRNGGVVLVYGAGAGLPSEGDTGVGLVLTEVPGSLESAYLRGGDLADARTGEVSVGDGRGYWAPSGGRHLPNALFWERGGLALRLEAGLPKRETIGIAESVR